MLNLLRTEFYKLKKSKSYKILLLSSFLLCVLIVSLFIYASNISELQGMKMDGFAGFTTSLSQMQTNIILFSIFAALFICSDFSNRTIGVILATGHSRLSVFLSKTVVYLVGVLGLLIVMPFFMTLILTIVNGFGRELTSELVGYMIRSSLLYILLNIGIATICLFIAFLIKNVGPSIGANIGVMITLAAITQISINETLTNIFKYTIFWQAYSFPTFEKTSDIIFSVVIGSITIIIALLATYLSFKKAELK